MNEHHFDKTKGQSAIEYLMTYGWMLLVVAIVGGAIFATVQGQCTQTTSGFSGSDVIVENFGTDSDGNIQMTLRNGGAETLEVENAVVSSDDGDNTSYVEDSDGNPVDGSDPLEIGVGNSESLYVSNGSEISSGPFESSDGCNDFELVFTYTLGELSNQESQGTLTDSIEFS